MFVSPFWVIMLGFKTSPLRDRWTTPEAKKWLGTYFCVLMFIIIYFLFHNITRKAEATATWEWSGIRAWNQVEKYRIVVNWKTKVSLDSLRIILIYSSSFSFFPRCRSKFVDWNHAVDFCCCFVRWPKGKIKLTKK